MVGDKLVNEGSQRMVDETDITGEVKWHYEMISQRAVKALKGNGIVAQFAADKEQALSMVTGMIPEGSLVGIGDSLTLDQIGVASCLERSNKYKILNPFARDAEGHPLTKPRERYELQRRVLLTDVFVTGTNAITLDGKIVNVDGWGNRVSAMIFGPHKVIVVVGANKIVKDEVQARQRIREFCAPVNAKRHLEKHHSLRMAELPCVKTGFCADCKLELRTCFFTVIIEGQRGWEARGGSEESEAFVKPLGRQRINVVIIGEALGL